MGSSKMAAKGEERESFQIGLGVFCEGCQVRNIHGRAIRKRAETLPGRWYSTSECHEFCDFLESIRLRDSGEVARERLKLGWWGTIWQLVPDLPRGLLRLKLFCHRDYLCSL